MQGIECNSEVLCKGEKILVSTLVGPVDVSFINLVIQNCNDKFAAFELDIEPELI